MRARSAGSDGFESVTAAGVSLRIEDSTETLVSPLNGLSPVAISCSITPSEKMSERGSTALPSACSGDMQPWQLYDPEFLEALRDKATKVTVDADPITMDLKVVR